MSRLGWTGLCILLASVSQPALAQEVLEAQSATPPERIDLLMPEEVDEEDKQRLEDCSEEQDAAEISREIIVCRRRNTENSKYYDKDKVEKRIAEETAFKKDPKTPDFILDCHDQGWPVGCVKMGSVPPPVYMIDFDDLPDTPPGSDADRAAQGLAPRGNAYSSDGSVVIAGEARIQSNADELGLPPPLKVAEEVSPSGSASPEEQPSG